MNNTLRIPTFLGFFLLILGLGAGVFLVQNQTFFRLRAAPDITPSDVRITNITDHSFTVSWVTEKQTSGNLTIGSKASLGFAHSITVDELTPATDYSFKINSAGAVFENNGIPWQVTTATKLPPNIDSKFLSGNILTPGGQPAANVLVVVMAGGMSPLSAITTSNGSWVIPLNSARTIDGTSFASIKLDLPIQILVQGGPLGVATAQAYPSTASPTPPITLGKSYDFRELKNSDADLPDAQFQIPQN